MLSKIAYLQGCLEAEWGLINSFRSNIQKLRGGLLVLFNRATMVDVWVRCGGAPGLEVNNENERLNLMAENARLVADFQCANDEL